MLSDQDIATYYDSIGGSQCPAIMGYDPNCTPYEMWLRYVDPSARPDLSGNEDVEAGNMLEEAIFRWGCERLMQSGPNGEYQKYIYSPDARFHHDYDFLRARPDGIQESGTVSNGMIFARYAGIECKNRSLFQRKRYGEALQGEIDGADDTDAVLPSEAIQCHHNMAVTGIPKWHLFVLTGGNRLRTYVINRDEAICQAIIEKCSEFWGFVQARTPPPPSNVSDCHLLWPQSSPLKAVEASEEIMAAVERRRIAKAEISDAEVREDLAEFRIKKFMQDAEELRFGGKRILTWKTQVDGKRVMRGGV